MFYWGVQKRLSAALALTLLIWLLTGWAMQADRPAPTYENHESHHH